jgi:hypothetical protein
MGLVLKPTLSDLNRQQVEDYIETIRAKRMVATLEFYQAANAKVDSKRLRVNDRLRKQVEMLGKDIAAMEKLEAKLDERLALIEQLKHEDEGLVERLVAI